MTFKGALQPKSCYESTIAHELTALTFLQHCLYFQLRNLPSCVQEDFFLVSITQWARYSGMKMDVSLI